jgi:hypothetical protein
MLRHLLLPVMLGAVQAPNVLVAQEPTACGLAVAAVAAVPRPDILSDTAASVRQLFSCPATGPAQIARLWMLPALSEDEATRLRVLSRYLLDTRILTTLVSLSRNTGSPSVVRQAAAAATLPYVDRDVSNDVGELRQAGRSSERPGFASGGVNIVVGSSPPTPSSVRDVSRLMGDLFTQTQDVALQEIGRAGFEWALERAPTSVVIPTSAITLTYMCGNRFRLRSRVYSTLLVRFDVYGTAISRRMEIGPPPVGAAFAELLFDASARGTVRVFFGTQLLQTKANGGTVCP